MNGRIFFIIDQDRWFVQDVEYAELQKCPRIPTNHDLNTKLTHIIALDEERNPWILKESGKELRKGAHRVSWNDVPWTGFHEMNTAHYPPAARPAASFMNSIYQVSVWFDKNEQFGEFAHLSFKTHNREPRHDWREMQRIKNDLAGPEVWAVEMFPPESKLVDTSNQYHLYCFKDFEFKNIGFQERKVTEGSYDGAVQRNFRQELRPSDLVPKEEMQRQLREYVGKKQ